MAQDSIEDVAAKRGLVKPKRSYLRTPTGDAAGKALGAYSTVSQVSY